MRGKIIIIIIARTEVRAIFARKAQKKIPIDAKIAKNGKYWNEFNNFSMQTATNYKGTGESYSYLGTLAKNH